MVTYANSKLLGETRNITNFFNVTPLCNNICPLNLIISGAVS